MQKLELFRHSSLCVCQMGRVAAKLNIDFVISTGDNFYDDGLTGIDDPAFEISFSKIYTAKSLQKQWYSGESRHTNHGCNKLTCEKKYSSNLSFFSPLNVGCSVGQP